MSESKLKKDEEVILGLARLLDHAPGLLGQWDLHEKNIHANRAYSEFFGKSPDEIRGMYIKDVLGPELYQQNLPYIRAVLRGERQVFEREIFLPSGGSKHTSISYVPDIVAGSVIGFFAFVTDISHVKVLEQERRNVAKQLVAQSRLSALGEMAGSIAHQINTPLATILLLAQQMKEELISSPTDVVDQISALESIASTAIGISKITKSLRVFSQSEKNDEMRSCDVHSLVSGILLFCSEKFNAAGINLRITPINNGLSCHCRPNEIGQVLLILLMNAFDATTELSEKWVHLDVVEDDEVLLFSVTDSGKGIPEDRRHKIMEPFYTTKPFGKGVGLGLSISKGIVESHKGSLSIDMTCPNTRFVFTIPKLKN